MNAEQYDRLIFNGARDLAVRHRNNIEGMRAELLSLNAEPALVEVVIASMQSPNYHEDFYRGEMCDESVIESLKDCLRPLHGF